MYKLEDNKIFFDGSFNFDKLEFINCGANSNIYKLKLDNEYYALKIFNNQHLQKIEKFEKKLDIKIPSFISPIKISYLNNKFNGYVMKLCRGENLFDQKLEISIGDFVKNSNKLFYDTDILSELKYLIQDESIANIMFDDGFKMIDIDFYQYYNEFNDLIKNIYDIKKFNKKAITRLLIKIFIRNAEIQDLFNKNTELEQLKTNCILGKISFNEFLNIICIMVYHNKEYENVKINQVGIELIKKIK